jgi:TorA maturation chaperone TorD
MRLERIEQGVGDTGSAASDPAATDAAIAPEDQARANLYALVSRLFYAPADSHLLAEICSAGQDGEGEAGDGGLVLAWRDLQETCRNAYPPVVKQEYDGLFVGVGRAEVTPYLSAYAEAGAPDRFLVRLRDQISALGLARRDSVFEVEDHISGISDVMRWLIESGRPLQDQQRFFTDFLYRGAAPFCAAVQKAPSARFYRPVVAFSLVFLELEKSALAMAD